MRIVIRSDHSDRLFSLTNVTEETHVGDILDGAHLDRREWATVWVDGVAVTPSTTLASAGVHEGSVISAVEPERPTEEWGFIITAGPDTGRYISLPAGRALRIGRSPQADIHLDSPTVSWSHCLVEAREDGLWVSDDNSSNGTILDGAALKGEEGATELHPGDVIGIGAFYLEAVQRDEDTSQQNDGAAHGALTAVSTVAFNRPPRRALPAHPKQLEAPEKKMPEKPGRLSWAAILAPIFMAVVLVAVLGSFRFALIALFSPVIAIGSFIEQKRRSKKSKIEEEEKFVAALQDFTVDIGKAALVERSRMRAQTPSQHELAEQARCGGPRLWQVRSDHFDFGSAQIGTGPVPFEVPLDNASTKPEPRVREILDLARIPAAPVRVDFTKGPVGIWGERDEAVALARSLVTQLATLSGPADMTIAVATDRARSEHWRWCAWLPHTRVGGANPNNRYLAFERTPAQSMLRGLRDGLNGLPSASLFLVIDDVALLEGRDCPARDLLAYRGEDVPVSQKAKEVSGIVLATRPEQLPASCHSVIEAKPGAELTLSIPSEDVTIEHIAGAVSTEPRLEEWARSLSLFDDPEVRDAGAALPPLVHLLGLLGLSRDMTSADITQLWQNNRGFRFPLGVSEDGTYWLDMVRDGPHGLVGGTTGSGKSEMLRTMVAGLAARVDPQHLTFILVDFKGGAAFATLDQLPHTIGTLSNLEPSLAYRALRALEAEMLYRQQCFAAAGEGVDNLDNYLATNPSEPMPRILVVVDEFAQLAKEYPDVLSSLVSIGAVGRTLGVHMVLATQRPAGVVNDDILANTNMRVALRVQSRDDSSNVIGVPHASSIGREQRGRAYIKLGEEDIHPIQTALVTGISDAAQSTDLHVDEIELGGPLPDHTVARAGNEESDVDLLIRAIQEAHRAAGFGTPRPVWPEPLGERVDLLLDTDTPREGVANIRVSAGGDTVAVALADDPSHQRQIPAGWRPAEGNLMLAGIPGSGTTTTLQSLALVIAATSDPATTDFLYLDLGGRGLEPLHDLPHSIGYAGPGKANRELQQRLLRYLRSEYDKRTTDPGEYSDIYVFIDSFATLREEYDDAEGMELLEGLYQVWGKGPGVGIHMVGATSRLKAIPAAVDEVTTQKWLYRLADSYDYSLVGVSRDNIPAQVPGRYVDAVTKLHGHVATIPGPLEQAIATVAARWQPVEKTAVVARLSDDLRVSDLSTTAQLTGEPWIIPVGVEEATLRDYCLEAYAGEHMLISGPARSGKSSVILGIATKLAGDARAAGSPLRIIGLASRRSPLHGSDVLDNVYDHEDVPSAVAEAGLGTTPTILVIDDAHQITEGEDALKDLLATTNQQLLIIAAGRNDDLRSAYGKWTATLRKSRLGILLHPNRDYDGDLLGVRLPRRSPVKMTAGRGYACEGGTATLIQAVTVRDDA